MAYSSGLFEWISKWLDDGILPKPAPGDRIVELGSQMINLGTAHSTVLDLIQQFRPEVTEEELSARFPVHSAYYSYACEVWRLCGLNYLSLDITEAPDSRVFDLNFHDVKPEDQQSAILVTNIGTTEHVVNQLNAFRVVHDLLKVGGAAIHQVPFTGMLNHCLFNYHPKFFTSLIINNRYLLRHLEFGAPSRHSDLGVGNTVYDGDYLVSGTSAPGMQNWDDTPLYSGMITLVIERRYSDPFVPPVDFAGGYFGETTGGDLLALVGREELPHAFWADAFRRGVTPSQQK